MTAIAARLFPKATADELADWETLISIALFSSAGLLLSLTILVIDKFTPGEWF